MRTVLHISDVHFGPPHRPEVAAGVLALIDERRPDLVIVSGDLTQRAKPRQFQQARRFIDAIPVPTLTVPGNHDVPLWRVWERVFVPFGAYRDHFSRQLEPVYRDDELLVIGINTAFNWTFKDGRITLRRIEEVVELCEAAPDHLLKIVVAHHHLIPPPNFITQRVLANAAEAVDAFVAAGVDMVLSGHYHQAYIGSSEEFYPSGRQPMLIVHSGTTTSSRGRAGEKGHNSCNLLQVDRRTIAIERLRWLTEGERFAPWSRHLFPRRGDRPYALPPGAAPAAGPDGRVAGDDGEARRPAVAAVSSGGTGNG